MIWLIRGLYTAAAGMVAQQTRLDVAANNLANAATPDTGRMWLRQGHCRSQSIYRLNDTRGRIAALRPAAAGGLLRHRDGSGPSDNAKKERFYRQTGRELDFALQEMGICMATPAGRDTPETVPFR